MRLISKTMITVIPNTAVTPLRLMPSTVLATFKIRYLIIPAVRYIVRPPQYLTLTVSQY